jgi:predicted porin
MRQQSSTAALRRGLRAIGALAAVIAGPAMAQSSVTLYGVADMGVVFESGNARGRVTKLTSGIASGSRLGFRGSEDLGGGQSAYFVMETGFGLDTGSNAQSVNVNTPSQGLWFGRLALVGLRGGWGSLQAGRLYTPFAATIAGLADPFATGMAGSAVNILNSTGLRANNAVQYSTPNWNGFTADAMVSLGEVAGDSSRGRGVGGTVGYANGPLNVKLTHWKRNAAVINIDAARNTMLAGTYKFGPAKLHAAYAVNRGPGSAFYLGQAYTAPIPHNPYGSATPPTSTVDSRDVLIGVTAPVGPGTLLASYIRRDDRTALSQDATQLAIGYSYPLSKRTDIYASVGRIQNKNGAGYTVGNGGDVTFGSGSRAYNIGIRHLF